MPKSEKPEESSLPEQHPVEEAKEGIKAPEAAATGNEKVSILDHKLYFKYGEHNEVEKAGVELSIKNISDATIGSAIFEAEFYDKDGNVVDTAEYGAFEMLPGVKGRTVYITSSSPERDKIESYNVRLVKAATPPAPTATGSEKIAILKHKLSEVQVYMGVHQFTADLVIKNILDKTISSAMFEAEFYDRDGGIIDTVGHRETNLKPGQNRGVTIYSSAYQPGIVRSYSVKTKRVITTDIEKVQLVRREVKTIKTGEVEVMATAKNISEAKTDAALVATFSDDSNETISTKVVIQRDIEPNSISQFNIRFKPVEGSTADKCDIKIVCDIEGL